MTRRAALQAVGTSLLAGCCSLPMHGPGWGPLAGTEYVLPRWTWTPRTAREVMDTVARADAEGHRIHMVGSGHSFSDVALSDDWLLGPSGLASVLEMPPGSLHPGVDALRLVRVGAGLRIRELNQALFTKGLALENMGGWDAQTFVGAAMTGTHGSGLAFGPLASQIMSIQVAGPRGELLQVEPTGGISDPATFPAPLPEDPSVRVRLLQEDDLFHALAVSMGTMGVVYAATVRAVDKYWLVERRTLMTWEWLSTGAGTLARMQRGEPIAESGEAEPDHVEIYVTPYASGDGTHVALLTRRWRTTTMPPLAGQLRRGGPWFAPGEELGEIADEFRVLEPIFAHLSTTEVRAYHVAGLKNMAQDYFADISFKVFSTGILNKLRVYGIELALAIEQSIDATNRLIAIADELQAAGIRMSSPVSLRFVAPARALLAPQYGRTTMMMEIASLIAAPGAEEMLRRFEDEFVAGFAARPHWGLDRNVLRGDRGVERLYPSWARWRRQHDRMNPRGTFDGRLSERLGIAKAR